MRWLVLFISGLLEAVWAHALGAGLHNPVTILVFAAALTTSMGGLAWAMKAIPLGTAYAVWCGVGTAATAVWSALSGEPFTGWSMFFLALIVAGVVGLQLASSHGNPAGDSGSDGNTDSASTTSSGGRNTSRSQDSPAPP